MTGGGLYVIELYLPRARRIRVGGYGLHFFPAGRYRYVGSAQRNLAPRVARHAKRNKVLRWHVDYLRRHCRYLGAQVFIARADECALAAKVRSESGGTIAHPRFGASDCRCPGHLVYLGE